MHLNYEEQDIHMKIKSYCSGVRPKPWVEEKLYCNNRKDIDRAF